MTEAERLERQTAARRRRQQLRMEAEALRAQVTRQCFHVHSLLAALDSATDPAIHNFAEMAEEGIAHAGDALDVAESQTVSATWALVGGGFEGVPRRGVGRGR